MSNENNYVIGAGVAGLTFSLLSGYKVFDANPMGQLGSKFVLGPRLIQYDNTVLYFLKKYSSKLQLQNASFVISNIGFKSGNKINNSCADDFKTKYTQRTRFKDEYESSFLSESKTNIKHIEFLQYERDSYYHLFDKMYSYLRNFSLIHHNNVTAIDIDNKTITIDNGNCFKYDTLVNTLNIKIFRKLLLSKNSDFFIDRINFDTANKNFYVTDYDKEDYLQSKEYKYIYSVSDDWTRKTFNEYVVYESANTIEKNTIENKRIIFKLENLPIQIIKSQNIMMINNIHMFGRYAQWEHKLKFNDLLVEARRMLN